MSGSRQDKKEKLKELFRKLMEEHFTGSVQLQLKSGELVGVVLRETRMKDKQKMEDLVWNKSEGEGYV
jgi:hypothetical protein